MAQIQGITNENTRPAATPEGTPTPATIRAGRYNEVGIVNYYPDQYLMALEGSYFIASSPTPGTGVAATTSLTAYVSGSTKPWCLIANNNAQGGPNIELDYMKIIQTAGQLPTTSTNMQIAIVLDTAPNKVPTTAGTALTPVNVNPASTNTSNAGIQIGAITTLVDSAAVRLVFQDYIEPICTATPVAVAGDFYVVKFGALDHVMTSNYYQQVAAGTPLGVKQISASGPPIVVAPGWCAVVKLYGTANAAAPTYSFEVGYRER